VLGDSLSAFIVFGTRLAITQVNRNIVRGEATVLRITKIDETFAMITMKLEGKLASDWVSLLESECMNCLKGKQRVRLDFSDVTFIDEQGIEMLGRLAGENVKVINCSALVKD